jgi:hypothetical protein
MPEKTARWTTMSDEIPNDESGGTDYLRDQTRAHPTNSTRRGSQHCGRMDRSSLQCGSSFLRVCL